MLAMRESDDSAAAAAVAAAVRMNCRRLTYKGLGVMSELGMSVACLMSMVTPSMPSRPTWLRYGRSVEAAGA